jgi:hypothetical protein
VSEKKFPILGTNESIDWNLIAPHEKQAMENHGQTLEKLARRHGLSWYELLCVMADKKLLVDIEYDKEKDYEKLCRQVLLLEEVKQYRAIGTLEECRAAMEKQIVEKELESHDEKHILKYCISLMQELVGKFEEWYEYVHGEDAIRELDEEERFYYRMSYFSIVQELFLFRTSHSGGTSTREKCKQLGVDWSDGIEFSFGGDEE